MSRIPIYLLLYNQIPDYIKQQYPIFVKFIEYYYRWLDSRGFDSIESLINIDSTVTAITIEKSTIDDLKKYLHHRVAINREDKSRVVAQVVGFEGNDKLLIKYQTVDTTFKVGDKIHVVRNSDDRYDSKALSKLKFDTAIITETQSLPSLFIDRFSAMLDADQLFGTNTPHIATILKNVRSLYQSKGNEVALKYLIKATKDIDVDVTTPWKNVLKTSDGKWVKPYAIVCRVDQRFWKVDPSTIKMMEIVDNLDENRNRKVEIQKVEIFGGSSGSYDALPFWWQRAFDENGEQNGYGYFDDDAKVYPYIRIYVDQPIRPLSLNQELRVIEKTQSGEKYVYYSCYVDNGLASLKIVDGGKDWQIGQVFEIETNDALLVKRTADQYLQRDRKSFINQRGVVVEHSNNKPTIGRVTAVDRNGAITGVEILQYGEHIPLGGDQPVNVIPAQTIGYTKQQIADCAATISFNYDLQSAAIGRYLGTDGWLSASDIHLQDSDYWQQFSYDIIANVDSIAFKDVADLLHPVGTKMFTTFILENDVNEKKRMRLRDGGQFTNLTLFDYATLIDHVFKTTIKPIKDDISNAEIIIKQTIKNLYEKVGVYDGDDVDPDKHVIVDSYDDSEDPFVERVYDGTKLVGYLHSGVSTQLNFNPKHTINHDVIDYKRYPFDLGGVVFGHTNNDNVEFINTNKNKFIVKDKKGYFEFIVHDVGENAIDQIAIFGSGGQPIKFETKTIDHGDYQTGIIDRHYQLTWTMPNSNVDVFVNITNDIEHSHYHTVYFHNTSDITIHNPLLSNSNKFKYHDIVKLADVKRYNVEFGDDYSKQCLVDDFVDSEIRATIHDSDYRMTPNQVNVIELDGGDVDDYVDQGESIEVDRVRPPRKYYIKGLYGVGRRSKRHFTIFNNQFEMLDEDVDIYTDVALNGGYALIYTDTTHYSDGFNVNTYNNYNDWVRVDLDQRYHKDVHVVVLDDDRATIKYQTSYNDRRGVKSIRFRQPHGNAYIFIEQKLPDNQCEMIVDKGGPLCDGTVMFLCDDGHYYDDFKNIPINSKCTVLVKRNVYTELIKIKWDDDYINEHDTIEIDDRPHKLSVYLVSRYVSLFVDRVIGDSLYIQYNNRMVRDGALITVGNKLVISGFENDKHQKPKAVYYTHVPTSQTSEPPTRQKLEFDEDGYASMTIPNCHVNITDIEY